MNVLLLQLDGKLPNLALMRLAAHYKALGADITFRRSVEHQLFDREFDQVYASLIFQRSRSLAERVLQIYPHAVIGGTGWDYSTTLEAHGIATQALDYSIYPRYQYSLGFTQRGCRLKCKFCVVPQKEGGIREGMDIMKIWRGEPWPRHLVLLDNDFFGSPNWQQKIDVIRRENFKVSFNQGINVRMLNDETAAAIATVAYYDDDFTARRIYTAWDNRKDEKRLFAGLEALVRHGVKPDHIMVYMLIGYWPGETEQDREYRRKALREFGARPYPMPYVRTPELVGFQRWVVRRADLTMTWDDYKRANFRPERVTKSQPWQRSIFPILENNDHANLL